MTYTTHHTDLALLISLASVVVGLVIRSISLRNERKRWERWFGSFEWNDAPQTIKLMTWPLDHQRDWPGWLD